MGTVIEHEPWGLPSWSVENSAVIDADGFDIFVRENREGGMKEGTELFCMKLFCERFLFKIFSNFSKEKYIKNY